MFKNLRKKVKNFTSYLLGYDKIFEEVENKLKQAKNKDEENAVLKEGLELSKEAIQRLATENADLREENVKLKEQLREHEEVESVISSNSSGSVSEVSNKLLAEVIEEETEIIRRINSDKKSTAPHRKTLKYVRMSRKLVSKVRELEEVNQQKDQKIKELENKQKEISLDGLESRVRQFTALIEQAKKTL